MQNSLIFLTFLRSMSLTFNLTTFRIAADGVGGKYYTFGKKTSWI